MTADCPVIPLTRFKVDNCRLAGLSTTESKVFVANVAACTLDGAEQFFNRVFFIESSDGCVWIAGCDNESLTLRPPREALVQAKLIKFLRDNNSQEQARFGTVLSPATARDSSEARVTQAYLEARQLHGNIRIGYCDSNNLFRVAILMPSPQLPLAVRPMLRLVANG